MTEYWEPRTEADLQGAINQGLLKETHVLDVKKAPPPPVKNLDIAVELANFAVDGGRIIYGIDQPSSSVSGEAKPATRGEVKTGQVR